MQIHADAVVLRVAIKEHAELQERIGAVLNTRNHASW